MTRKKASKYTLADLPAENAGIGTMLLTSGIPREKVSDVIAGIHCEQTAAQISSIAMFERWKKAREATIAAETGRYAPLVL